MLDAPAPALARPQATCEMTHSADQKFHRDFPAGLRRDFSGEESHEQSLLEPALKADSIFLGSAARTLHSVCVYSHLESTSGAFHLSSFRNGKDVSQTCHACRRASLESLLVPHRAGHLRTARLP